jgi:hypothetical protein
MEKHFEGYFKVLLYILGVKFTCPRNIPGSAATNFICRDLRTHNFTQRMAQMWDSADRRRA